MVEMRKDIREIRQDVKTLIEFKGWMRGWVFGIAAFCGSVTGAITSYFFKGGPH